jgi:hypothetical protein
VSIDSKVGYLFSATRLISEMLISLSNTGIMHGTWFKLVKFHYLAMHGQEASRRLGQDRALRPLLPQGAIPGGGICTGSSATSVLAVEEKMGLCVNFGTDTRAYIWSSSCLVEHVSAGV